MLDIHFGVYTKDLTPPISQNPHIMFFYKLGMFCFQIMYLFFNHLLFSHVREMAIMFRESFVECIIRVLQNTGDPIYLLNVIFTAYPIISAFSFGVFVWAYITGNLHKHDVFFICNLPLVVICLMHLPMPLGGRLPPG
jgi:hypothetical protein